MERDFSKSYFSRDNIRFNIHNLSYLPRWIIVLIDLSVLLAAFLLTHLIFEGMGLQYVVTPHPFVFVGFLFGTNLFFFWLFRTYAGIIRHSSYIDAIKLLFSQTAVLVFFLVYNYLFELYFKEKVFLNTAFFINMVLSFCGLFLYRVVVKQTFELYFIEKNW